MVLAIANLGTFAEYLNQYQQKRDAAIANQTAQSRYKNGCIYVKAIATGKPATLVPNIPVINKNSAGFFPAGTVVCDIYGNTGIVKVLTLDSDYRSPNGRFYYPKGAAIPAIDPKSLAYTGNPPQKGIPEDANVGWIGRITNVN